MLPPKLPGHSPPNTSVPAGATARRPSIGRSGTSIRLDAEFGRSRMPMFRAAIELPDEAARRQRIVEHPRARVPCHGTDAVRTDRRHRGVTIQLDLEDLDDERIVGGGAFDMEWTDFAGPGAARALVVVARLREAAALDNRTRLDAEHGLADAKGWNAARGLELNCGSAERLLEKKSKPEKEQDGRGLHRHHRERLRGPPRGGPFDGPRPDPFAGPPGPGRPPPRPAGPRPGPDGPRPGPPGPRLPGMPGLPPPAKRRPLGRLPALLFG